MIRLLLSCIVASLMVLTNINAQGIKTNLPRGLSEATADPGLTTESALIVSITANDEFYVGKDRIPKNQLGGKISELVKHDAVPTKIIYVAVSANLSYKSVVEVLNIIREQKVGQIGLIVNRSNDDSLPGVFLVFLPMPVREGEDISKLKPNPLTLVASMSTTLQLRLNDDDGRGGQLCLGSRDGLGSDPDRLQKWLTCLFRSRTEQRAYRIGMETRNDLPLEQRIEKTVFVKAPLSIKYIEVLRVINGVKGAGANLIGLQIDDLLN